MIDILDLIVDILDLLLLLLPLLAFIIIPLAAAKARQQDGEGGWPLRIAFYSLFCSATCSVAVLIEFVLLFIGSRLIAALAGNNQGRDLDMVLLAMFLLVLISFILLPTLYAIGKKRLSAEQSFGFSGAVFAAILVTVVLFLLEFSSDGGIFAVLVGAHSAGLWLLYLKMFDPA
jgi:hypothetical protein